MTWDKWDEDHERNFGVEECEKAQTLNNMNLEQLTKITTLSGDINIHFERAWKASMTQDNGKPDLIEMQHQYNLAVMELEKLNDLIWPDENMVISDVLASREIYNLDDMD